MKVLLITPYDINDTQAQSGTILNIKRSLEQSGNEVFVIDNLKINKLFDIVYKIKGKLIGKKVDTIRSKKIVRGLTKQVERRKQGIDYDIILSTSSLLCTYIKTQRPLVYYSDATYGGMLNYYIDEKEWDKTLVKEGMELESLAIKRSNLVILASSWAVDSAKLYHNAPEYKCIAINRGANIETHVSERNIDKIVDNRIKNIQKNNNVNFLFVGRDWERKGGPKALKIVKALNKINIKSKLFIVGCEPILNKEDTEYVDLMGYLEKKIDKDYQTLKKVYESANFYLQPSVQEAQGIAYAEASAYGLPIIAINTGGVSDIVTSKNGLLFHTNDSVDVFVEEITKLIKDIDLYKELNSSAFSFYKDKLSWESVGRRISGVLNTLIE